PPLKRRCLEVPVRTQRERNKAEKRKKLDNALSDVQKLLKSKKTKFEGGPSGLQAYRTLAIQSLLRMSIKNGRLPLDASQRAAESHGFAAKWGGRNLLRWTKDWIRERILPQSQKGRHGKVYSVLDDPAIRAELRSYVRSHKWAMNPSKLKDFSAGKLVPDAADKYLRHIVREEMPRGLKKYMEVELFPRIQMKVKKGDEMTAQAHDTVSKSWVLDNQHKLRKKGVGRGLHQSDVICSTVGWLSEASQTLEYGKNYDGYWTGDMFCTQLTEKIIPAFERVHGPGYQALFMVDNSQGHSAYSADALVANRMNVNPGGKQPCLRNGWYEYNGQRFPQEMVFPADHPTFPNLPKGLRQILTERGINTQGIRGKCKNKSVKRYLREHCDMTFETLKENMPHALSSVQLATIRKWEHRMHRWMDAYREGLGTQDAQVKVKQFSSTRYKSHRRIPETVAQAFD
ncbi:hypothetical protein FPV67DRAFT_1384425, partial [Lyophyllum atratum]